MPDGNQGDESFFVEIPGGTGKSETGHIGTDGAGPAGSKDTANLGGSSQSFTQTPPAAKRRGRPPGSKNSKGPGSDSFRNEIPLGEDSRDAEARKQAKEIMEGIKARHLMLSILLGVPELQLDDKKASALAVAWVRFQQEYPATKISRKASVIIELATVSSVTYGPILGLYLMRAKAKADARKKPGFNVPPENPAMRSASDSARQSGPVGDEVVLSSGAVDRGTLDFGT